MSAGLAARAVRLAQPAIDSAMASHEAGDSGFLHVVVMDPRAAPGTNFESAILYEQSFGDRSRWDADYAAYARAKARMSWRTGLPGHRICETSPHLLLPDEQPLWGSAVVDGMTVGVSGAFPWFDEAFAGIIAHFYIACVKAERFGKTP
ncbi:MAG: hypothetical protein M0R28_13995 [Pigmentiphaga sp.]|nr:hypothetical protein [Pigmentiphaga sp.]